MDIGDVVLVNGYRDLACLYEARSFICERVVIMNRCKSGLIQVHLETDSKQIISLPKYNLTEL